MGREKQNNYYVVNQFLANVPFLHPLKTGETLLLFRCAIRMKKRKIGQKRVNNLDKEIISIRNNATLIYGINLIQLRQLLAITTLSAVSLSSFPRKSHSNLKVNLQWFNSRRFVRVILPIRYWLHEQDKVENIIDKIRNFTKVFIFFSSSFKSLMNYWWKENLKGLTERPTFDTDLLTGYRSLILFFSVVPPNN